MNSRIRISPRARRASRNPHPASRRRRRTHRGGADRRGVILLVVLGMLALFTVVVLTFVIVARQNMTSANAALRSKFYDDGYEEHLNQAALQIIRGTGNTNSVIGPHSLLEDMYGDPNSAGVFGTINSVAVTGGSGGHLYDVTITSGTTLSTIDDYFNGRVMTTLNGSNRSSYRIVDYDGSSQTFRLLSNSAAAPVNTADVLINGRAFAGPGFGYQASNFSNANVGDDLLNYGGAGSEIALLPNPRDTAYQNYLDLTMNTSGVFANEDHDSPGIQDMLLALRVSSSTLGNSVPIPSLHRPALIQYWLNYDGQASFDQLTIARQRQIMLRPSPADHYVDQNGNNTYNAGTDIDFTGKLNFDPINGPWDVDNDGDGIPDSIWVDIGLPVETAPDGRQYKPLVAILCLDMDGKLNLNVHGHLNDWNNEQNNGNPKYTNPQTHQVQQSRPPNPPAPLELAGLDATNTPFQSANLLSGMGLGPQEVCISTARPDLNLTILLPDNEFRNLLRGLKVGTRIVEGKYGEGHLLPAGASSSTSPVLLAGETGVDDNLPAGAIAQVAGSPIDPDGNGVLALDPRGQPRFYFMGSANSNNGVNSLAEALDDATEFDPTARRHYTGGGGVSSVDAPYGPADLEWLLRQSDIDGAALPSRLPDLCSSLIDSGSFRYNSSRATTESYDLPVPNFVPTPEIARGLALLNLPVANLGIVDLVRGKLAIVYRYRNPMGAMPAVSAFDTHVNTLISQDVIAPELLAGYRFNVNRAFGAGDDNNLQRRAYARHLYFLMQLLTDYNYALDVSGAAPVNEDSASAARRELTAHRIAQWCINVVDFRDADAKMTPFEYIIDPFVLIDPPPMMPAPEQGWNLERPENLASDEATLLPTDQFYNTGRRLVWGSEAPALLLSETLAFHDRRVEDLADGMMRVNATNTGYDDNDWDQRRVPQGSAFFELYCPANNNTNNPTVDAGLFDTTTGNLQLGKIVGTDPVWRLAITASGQANANNDITTRVREKPYSASLDPLDAPNLVAGGGGGAPTIERIVWFTTTAPGAMHADKNRIYYSRGGGNVDLPPGQYAVVGPRRQCEPGSPRINDNVTKIGSTAAAPVPQEIALTGTPFKVTDNNGPPDNFPTAEIQSPYSIPVAGDATNAFPVPVGISISEPALNAYYPPTDTVTTDPNDGMMTKDAYATVFDEPLDTNMGLGAENTALLRTGTTRNYKTVFLQRLADPTLPYNATTNPYRTVDWMPIDLTVFNGESNPAVDDGNVLTFEANDPQDLQRGTQAAATANAVRLGTRQRGTPRTPPAAGVGTPTMDLWSAVSDDAPTTVIPGASADRFGRLANLDHTLGYINEPFHVLGNTPPWWGMGNTYGAAYRGDPRLPFPWLNWSNRPFASQFELMQVPYSTSARLTWDYGYVYNPGAPGFYTSRSAATPTGKSGVASSTPYAHLLNFFLSSNGTSDPTKLNNDATALPPTGDTDGAVSNYYRIFDYLNVPSPFSGAAVELPTAGMPTPFNAQPYNRLPSFREPGKINVNTISDVEQRTWLGATNSFNSVQGATYGNGNATWDQMRYSRQHYSGGFIETPGYLPPNSYPDAFGNPFRSPGTANYAPLASMRNNVGNFVDGSWLRQVQAGGNAPLFQFLSRPGIDTVPGGSYPYRDAFNDSDRNPYFRYQMYSKMGNVLTTRSNVYAIWITVGFFEVTPWDSDNDGDVDFDTGHTDGYALRAELGSDTGEIKRHRAFYVFDRSIPVAFERGKNHNVHRGMLVKRIIE